MKDEKNKRADEPMAYEEEQDAPAPEAKDADTLRILEALLFASDEIMPVARLKAILPGNPGGREIGAMVEKINRYMQKERHPFEIVEIGGGYLFKTVAYYHPWVRQIFQEKAAKRLSIQALECLSIIAYRQPLSKAEIEAIRGVISDGAMKTLLEKRLITITGRSDKPGRPLLYGTTTEFLTYFGLNKITDLPNIEEFEAMVRQKIENLPIDQLEAAQAAQAQAKSEAAAEEGQSAAPVPEHSAAKPLPEEASVAPKAAAPQVAERAKATPVEPKAAPVAAQPQVAPPVVKEPEPPQPAEPAPIIHVSVSSGSERPPHNAEPPELEEIIVPDVEVKEIEPEA